MSAMLKIGIILLNAFLWCECFDQSSDILPFSVMKEMIKRKTQQFQPQNSKISQKQKAMQTEKIKGINIRVIYSQMIPYVELVSDNNITGYLADLWKTLEEILQFRTELILIENAAKQKKALKEGIGDILLTPVVPTETDLDNFNHTIPIANTWYHLYVKEDNNISSNLYFHAWSKNLWYAFMSTIIALTFALWTVHGIRVYYCLEEESASKNEPPKHARKVAWMADDKRNEDNTDYSVGNCFLCVLGAVANQGTQMKPSSNTIRILNLVNLFFGFLMFTSYSGVLVSKLTVTGPSVSFPTIESVAEFKTHSLCVSENSFAYRNFKVKDDEETIVPRWIPVLNRKPCTVGRQGFVPVVDYCSSQTVVLETPYNKEHMRAKHPGACRITPLTGKHYYTSLSLLVRKGFNYTNLLNTFLLRLQSTGVTTRLREKWFTEKPHENFHDPEYAVTWNHIKDIFIGYCSAVGLSLLILIFEIIISKKSKCRKKIKDKMFSFK